MAIVYTGPFAGLAGGGFAGWSNHVTGAGALFSRYSDGDPYSSFVGREMAGNVNYKLATDRRLIASMRFNSATGVEPPKNNTGNSWVSRDAIYTVFGPCELTPNARRGVDVPPRLTVRVRARTTAGVGPHHVRLYAVGSELDCIHGWPFTGARGEGYVDFSITAATYPANGFSAEGTLTIPVDPANWYCTWQPWDHPAVSTIGRQDVDVLCCHFVLAAIGDGVNGTYVAGLEVWEEAPGA